jgi:hypothetical protein
MEGCNNAIKAAMLQLSPTMGERYGNGTGWGLLHTWLPLHMARQLQLEAHSSSTATSDSMLGIVEL